MFMMDNRRIYDIPKQEKFEIYILIKNVQVLKDRNDREYMAFTFQDKSGTIVGMYWSALPEEVKKFTSGTIVRLRGMRDIYNGQPQVKIIQMRVAEEGLSPNDFIIEGPFSKEEMQKEIADTIKEIVHPKIRAIVQTIMSQYRESFYSYPAAKSHHHAFIGGLGFHTLSMLRLAKAIANQYPVIDKSLLYGGVILHDAAKVIEFKDPLSGEYSLEGNLIGHISLMGQKISLVAKQLGYQQKDEAVVLLKHMILAHHGEYEYGSPVRPQLLEAEVLHRIDDLDAKLNMIENHLKEVEPGHFSSKIVGLDSRTFYKPGDEYLQDK